MLDESEDVLVETLQGPVRGEILSGIRVFRGIPYAAPPTGDRRFLPLEPAESWTEPRDATRFGSAAPQFPDPLDDLWGRLAPGDEDCTSLNIWAPARPADRPRPVMVWIHGGAFVIGSGKWPWYEGCNLAQRGDVVLVTINYRLGALGFLDLSELGDDRHRTCGNHGLLDQVCALRWIRDNIERFGGDPKNVTLFGESAGGISIACLLAMPEARGLFQRVIVMSGGANLIRFPKLSREVARTYLKIAGVESVAECSRLPTKVLMKAQKRLLDRNEYGGDAVFGPVVDGRVLPEPPLHAIRSGCASEVGLMTGTTLDEARLWSLYVPILRWAHPRALGRVLRHAVGDRGREVVSAYRRSRLGDRPGNLSMAINGDLLFRMPAIRLAEAQSEHRPHDTRMYLFTWSTPVSRGRLGSPHAVDVPFVFGNLDQEGVERFTGKGADRRELSMRIQDAWLAFARTGDPSHSGLPHWPPYRRDSRATMIFDSSPTVVNDPRPEERKAWDGVPFDGVVPAIEQSLPTTGEILRSLVPNPFSRA
ncbi:MAG: carboxylesterase/lipase family protein [Isosphaeraceae bacterium]|nr:carboxylesterase/lipase family protein [Isosphaeraceae bacterium]